MSGDIALYVHLPFCRRKCCYCSFISYPGRTIDIPQYLNALENELRQRTHGEHFRTIYLGGGTPTLLSVQQINNLLSIISRFFDLDKNAEISMEANPGTVDEAYLAEVWRAGVNRLSLGVQSFRDSELETLGRIHTAAEAKEAARWARCAGFDNLNLDLIYGLPGQTISDWRFSMEEALALKPEHLSLYALTLEHETPLQALIDNGTLPIVNSDLAADQYELAEDLLAAHGYDHYEISNWAKPGYECRHNLVYWYNLPYLGVGVAAHSCLGGHRLANTSDLDKYLRDFTSQSPWKPEMDEVINPTLELAETVILGLRLGNGIDNKTINSRFGIDIMERFRPQIEEMTTAGLMERSDGHLRLTPRGRLLSNEVFWRFLPE
jgi:oxygen-independent coproporphyrinogen III oxidase